MRMVRNRLEINHLSEMGPVSGKLLGRPARWVSSMGLFDIVRLAEHASPNMVPFRAMPVLMNSAELV